jgi:hypothetical protein
MALITGFISWRLISDKEIQNLETAYWKTTEIKGWGDFDKWTKLKLEKENAQKGNMTWVYLIGLQTFVTFISQVVGQRRTGHKVYKWTSLVFGILFLLVGILIFMMALVSSGPLL